jgi:serine protease AprX
MPVDSLDLPVNPHYLAAIQQAGFVEIKHTSRWFNSAVIFVVDTLIIDDIRNLPMVLELKKWPLPSQENPLGHTTKYPVLKRINWNSAEEVESFYGPSEGQLSMMGGPLLHAQGFTGEGVHIAVMDAGWNKANVLPTFDRLRAEERLLGTRDFVFEQNDPVYSASDHGTYVWSIMAGYSPGQLIGSAFGASYYLLRTENPSSEYLAEEWNWVAGAEFADSSGVDIINSSLGYSQFDWPSQNHTYEDMNGQSTRVSQAADIASSKGILVVNSAGNSGDNAWRYITAPSDGDDVLCVGAVRADSTVAWFSSRGPSFDGDVKPNVSGQGVGVVFASVDSTFATGNGTSFSSPLVAGLAACLWQAFPNATNKQIKRAIEKSAHLAYSPNDDLGFGIPNFWSAYKSLANMPLDQSKLDATLWPNPSTGSCFVQFQNPSASSASFQIFDALGHRIWQSTGALSIGAQGLIALDLTPGFLQAGCYFLHVEAGDRHTILPWIVVNP